MTPAELQPVLTCRGDANRCGMTLLLKTVSHLSYVADPSPQVPEEVRLFVAGQLGLLWDPSEAYSWHGSTHDYHLAQIREHTGWRFPTVEPDYQHILAWRDVPVGSSSGNGNLRTPIAGHAVAFRTPDRFETRFHN